MTGADERGWDAGWDGHAEAQRRRMARLPLTEKLQWLEDAHRLVRHLQRSAPAARPPHDDPRAAPPPSG